MKKDLDYYLSLDYTYLIKRIKDEGYFGEIRELKGCWADGDTIDECINHLERVKKNWLEIAIEIGKEIIEPKDVDDYSGRILLRIGKSMHKEIVEKAKEESMSMNQFALSIISRGLSEISIEKDINYLKEQMTVQSSYWFNILNYISGFSHFEFGSTDKKNIAA